MSVKRKPRITCPHCHAVYVLEKEGEPDVKAEEPADATPDYYDLPLRGHDWFAMFFRLRANPGPLPRNVAPLGQPPKIVHEFAYRMLKAARNGEDGLRCPYAERPTDEDRDALAKIEVGSEAFEDWRKRLADEGYVGFGQDGSKWVWVPKGSEPEAMERRTG